MDVGQAKTRFFKRDSTQADKLTLHAHKEREFWLWCSSWAMFLQSPEDLGYDGSEYQLPELRVHWHELPTDHSVATPERNGQRRLLSETTISVQTAAKERRRSLPARIERMVRIVNESTQVESPILRSEPGEGETADALKSKEEELSTLRAECNRLQRRVTLLEDSMNPQDVAEAIGDREDV